jgi:hypothetical protein
MCKSLLELPWHDAILMDIKVDRRNPGNNDCVLMVIDWPNGGKSEIEFQDCYAASLVFNFGVLAEETIRNFSIISEGPEMDAIRTRLSSFGPVVRHLNLYRVETNSTASILEIVAMKYRMVDLE